jgi:hypothetical protein
MEAKIVVKMKFLGFALVCIVLSLQFAFAFSPLEVSSNKNSYGIDENLNITALISNINPYPQEARLETLLRNDEGTSKLAVIPHTFVLNQGEQKYLLLYSEPVRELPAGRYNVTAMLFFGTRLIDTKKISFFVNGQKKFEGKVLICRDIECLSETRVFTKGEAIRLQFSSSEDITPKTILTMPSGEKKEIQLPYTLNADAIGAYVLETSAEKNGYGQFEVIEKFSVIEKPAEIPAVEVKDIETPQELRGTAPLSEKGIQGSVRDITKNYLYIIGGIVLLIILVVVIIVVKTRKNRNREVYGSYVPST